MMWPRFTSLSNEEDRRHCDFLILGAAFVPVLLPLCVIYSALITGRSLVVSEAQV